MASFFVVSLAEPAGPDADLLTIRILQVIVRVSFSAPNASQQCGAFLLFAQHERILTGASPQTALIVGRLQPKARVSIVRWNLKEAGGKRLAR